MLCISLYQPWATAMALGSKRVETRSWPTKHRGMLAIHASKRVLQREMADLLSQTCWQGALGLFASVELMGEFPLGAVVAVGNLVECVSTEKFCAIGSRINEMRGTPPYEWTEFNMGDFSRGRYVWVFQDMRALPKPIPFRGSQGFFEVPDELFVAGVPKEGEEGPF